ncbi:acyl-CoA dehydrogenase family protein [Streptomyces sp. NPDC015501]|uniref:acyl-CoA dehydrogenase family protein n=1 Tax=Streptomyces sp. NPDC015501 TaxID=3364959 RepID=UPI0011A98F09
MLPPRRRVASSPRRRVAASPRRRAAAPPRGPARPAGTVVQHAREREQFGSPMGPFRRVEHLCVDGPARAGPVRAPGYGAAVTGDPAEIAGAAPLAEGAAVRVARDRLRLPGGRGFTWEADVHLRLERARLRAAEEGARAGAEEAPAAGPGAARPGSGSSAAYRPGDRGPEG